MPAKRRPRASLYVRLSKQADDSNVSLDGMIADMRALCSRLGFEEVALHVDDGKTGGRRDRDEFKAWLDDARRGYAEVLVNPNTDRLTREGLNVAASILDVVEGKDPATGRPAHKPVRLVDTAGLDSEHGEAFRFRFVIQAEVARGERERMRDRSRSKNRRLIHQGRWPGGEVPFGYRTADNPDGPGKVLAIAPDEAQAILEAADQVLAGDPLGRVVRRWNHAQVKPRRAERWTRVTVRQVLCGDAILGRVTYQGKLVRNDDGTPFTPFPAIITPAMSERLRQLLAVKTPDARKGGRLPSRLLSRFLTCHDCRAYLQVVRRKDGYVAYRCQTRADGGICERPVVVGALLIEDYVSRLYLGTVGHLPMMRERVILDGVDELADVEAQIKDLVGEIAQSATPELVAQLQKLQARRDELAAIEPEQHIELVPTGRTIAEHWDAVMVDDRRDLLHDAFEELILHPGRRGPRTFDPARLTVVWTRDAEVGEPA